MSTPGTFSEALSEIDRLQKVVKVLRESLGEPGAASTVSLADRLVDHEESARVLRELIDGTDPSKGEEFFSSLVRHLATALRMKYAVIWTFLDEARDRMQSLAVWAGDKPGENFTASIPGTPCEQTVQHRAYCEFAGGVQQQFPRAEILATLKVESYFAAPLFGTDGQVMGSLVVMDDRPGRLSPSQRTLLDLFAARAGAELGRQKAELALKRSEAHFRALIEQASDVVTVLATDGTVRYQSPSLERVMGWRPEERQGKSAFEQMHPDDVSRAQATIREALAHPGEVRSGEFRLRHREGAYRTLEIVGRVVMDLTGAPCIILNMRDVTERRQAERDRQQALQDLQNILETVPDFLFTIDADGRLVRWNSRVAQTTGYDSEELLNKPALDFVPGEEREQTAAAIRRAFAEGYAELEGHLMTKDGRLIPYHWTGAALKNAQGDLIGITGVGRDVTERKRSEAEIRRHRRHLLDAQALAHLGSWEWDIDSGTVTWSEEQCRIFGHIPGALVVTDDTFLAALHPDDHDRVLKAINDALLSKAPYDVICRIVRPSGDIRFVHCRGEVDRDEAGRPIRMAGTVLDVTERVHIEEALRAGEERWQLAVRGSNDGIWDWNIKTGDIFLSSRWKAIRGFADEELGHHVDEWRSRIHPDDLDRVLQRLDAYLFRQAPEYREEYRVLCKDGSYRWVLDRGMAVWDENGTPLRMAGSESDITERKQAEMALRMSEERLRLAMDIAKLATWDWNIRTNQVIWSDNCEAVKQLPKGTFKGTFEAYQQLLHPDDLPRLQSDIERALAGRDAYHTEHRLVTPDGGIQWIEGNGYVYRDESNQPIRMIGTARNITERKNTEEALRTSEERLRQALHASNTGLWDWNTETGEVRFSKEWKGQLGYGETELADSFETWESRLHPDDREQAVAYAQAYRLNPVGAFRQDFRLRHKDGSYRWIDSHASFVTEPDGRRVRLLGSHTDITDRKKGEEQLRLTQFTMDRLSEAIFWVGPDARMTYVNDAASRMLGYTKEELLSMSVPEIDPNLPADAWASHWDDLKRRGGFTFESNHRRKDGTVFRTEVTVNYLRFGGKEVNCAIMRDISERKRAEEALRISEERFRLATEATDCGVLDHDMVEQKLFLSPGFTRMLGVPDGTQITVEQLLGFNHPEDASRVKQAIRAAHDPAGDGKYSMEKRIIRPNGEVRWLSVLAQTFFEGEGPSRRAVRALGVVLDTTERKQAEEALRNTERELRASRDRFEAAVQGANDGIWDWDLKTNEVYLSERWKSMIGYQDHELANAYSEWETRIHQDDRARVQSSLTEYLASRAESFDVEFRLRKKSGDYCWIHARGKAVRDAEGRPYRMAGSHTDITERKRAEEALRISEERYARATAVGRVGVWELDVRKGEYYGDNNLKALFGYAPNELSTDPYAWLNLVHPEDQTIALNAWERIVAGETDDYAYHIRMRQKGGNLLWTVVRGRAVRDEHGRVTRLIGATVDVTERHVAELELQRTKDHLEAVIKSSPLSIVTFDPEGLVTSWNPASERMFGWTESEAVGREVPWIPEGEEEACEAYWRQIVQAGGANGKEVTRCRKDGSRFEMKIWAAPVRDGHGTIVQWVGFLDDVTELKQAHRDLQRSERELRTVLDALPIGVWFTDSTGKPVLSNPASQRIWSNVKEVEFESGSSKRIWKEVARSVNEPHRWTLSHVLTKGEPSINEVFELKCGGGVKRTILNSAVPVRADDGTVLGAVVLNEDITDRVRAEEELRQHHKLLSAIMDASIDIVYVKDLEGRYVHMNRAGAKILGMSIEDIIGWGDVALWGGDLAAACRASDKGVLESGGTVTVEEVNTVQGAVSHYLTTKAPYRDPEGRIIGIIGISRDITQQKLAEIERERRYSELHAIFGMTVALSRASTLEEIYQKALDGVEEALKCRRASILLFDQQGAMRFVADRGLSDEYRRAVDGHSPWSPKTREPQPILVRDTTTDPAVESHRTAILAEGIRAMAFVPLMSPDGLLGKFMLYYHEPHEFTEDEIGVVQTIAGHVAYVIQRARAEEALRLSEDRFAKAFRASLHPVVIGELETGRVIEANDAAYQLFGYTREDAVGRTTLEIGLWPSAEDRARFVQLLKRQGSVRNLEANLRTKSGVRQCLLSSELIELDGKQCMVTVGNDITDRKRAEEELRRSHAFLRQVIDIDPNFIFAKDREGRFTLVNKAVADVYGTTVENLNGKTDADFNPDLEQVEFFRRMDTEVMDSLKERFIPEEVITDAGGRQRWLQTVKRPILDEHGRATMVLGAATDITERKRMEEALRQREQDLCAAIQEREQISQDLHDGILQSLYAIGLSLETCRPELKKFRAKRITRTLDSVVSQLNAVMGEVRAFIAGLETELWKKQDLSSAIRTMVQTMTLPHAARYRVAIDPSVNEALSPEQGMHLFSIVKEAMSNCLRHAKATRASVSLRRSGEGFKLTVTDNGVGFVPAEVAQTGRGLANMASRATRLGGLFSIQSKPKQGTRINLTIPKETVHA